MWNNWSSHNETNKIPTCNEPTESYDTFVPMETFKDESMLSHRISIRNDASHVTIDIKNEQKIHHGDPGKKLPLVLSNQTCHDKILQVSSFLPLQSELTTSKTSTQPESETVILLQPLSAYNLFFQLQRRWIISHDIIHNLEDLLDHKDTYDDLVSLCHLRQMKLSLPQPKRRHRRSHNKISFRELSKHIAKKWKDMNPNEKNMHTKFAREEKKKYEKEKKNQQKQDKAKLMKQKEIINHRDNDNCKTTSYESYNTYSLNRQDESKISHEKNHIEKVVEELEDDGTCKILSRNFTTTSDNDKETHHVPQDGSVRCVSTCTNSLEPQTKEIEKIVRFSPSNNHSNILEEYDDTQIFLSNDDETHKMNKKLNATNSLIEQTSDLNVFDVYKVISNMNHNYFIDGDYTDDIEHNNNNNDYLKSIEEMEVECDYIDEHIFHIMKRIQYRSVIIKNMYRKQKEQKYYRSTQNHLFHSKRKAVHNNKVSKMFSNKNMKSDGHASGQSSQSPRDVIKKNESLVADPFIFTHVSDPLINDCSSNSLGSYMDNTSASLNIDDVLFKSEKGFNRQYVNDELYQQTPEIENYLDDNCFIFDNDEFMI